MAALWFVILTLVVYTTASLLYNTDPKNPPCTNLHLIGTVNGKSFFASGDSINRTWFEARDYCNDMGMQLAKIETQAEADLIAGGYNEEYFSGVHWVAGRDAHAPRQFSWDGTEAPVEMFAFGSQFQVRVPTYQTCVSYYQSAIYGNFGSIRPCTEKWNVLCEAA